MTSHHVVHQVRKLLAIDGVRPKTGHAGTLDPFAEGILPLAIGEATKTVSYQMNTQKAYEFTLIWGEKRDTADRDGVAVAHADVVIQDDALLCACQDFVGGYEQTPPVYSAIKINGKRACDRARTGETVDLSQRKRFVDIYDLSVIDHDAVSATLHVICGKGTYVRVLAEDIAAKLGTLAYVDVLVRTEVGKFVKKDAISLGKLEEVRHKVVHTPAWVSLRESLDDIPALELVPADAERLWQGRTVSRTDLPNAQTFVGVLADDTPVGILERIDTEIRPKRMFNIRHDNERIKDVDNT